MNRSVLVLNSDYSPLHVCNLRRAIRLMLAMKVDVLQSSDEIIGGRNLVFNVPSVVRLKYYIKRPYSPVPLTRQNIHIRDNYQCQYCGSKEKLTLDHIHPIKRGGQNTWENLVTCCFKCNNKKGDQPLEKTDFVLKSKPKRPSHGLLFKFANQNNASWQDYLPELN